MSQAPQHHQQQQGSLQWRNLQEEEDQLEWQSVPSYLVRQDTLVAFAPSGLVRVLLPRAYSVEDRSPAETSHDILKAHYLSEVQMIAGFVASLSAFLLHAAHQGSANHCH